MDTQRKHELLAQLVRMLEDERGQSARDIVDEDDPWLQFRALVNTREPWPASDEFLSLQDELLQGLIAKAGIHTKDDADVAPIDSRLNLWRGDITTLETDAIVNAANAQMLGCWAPLHYCIDNAIHTFAGVQLRIECARLMAEQGHEEPTGQAKITSAFNLPSSYVLHTVGPIARGNPSDLHREQLASCYTHCLDTAANKGLRTVAFCCISTGVFGFPNTEAAEIALATVRAWLNDHESNIDVIFNVYGEKDERIYQNLLGF